EFFPNALCAFGSRCKKGIIAIKWRIILLKEPTHIDVALPQAGLEPAPGFFRIGLCGCGLLLRRFFRPFGCDLCFHFCSSLIRPRTLRQQRTRFCASPASLVSLYFVLMSLPVSARGLTVVSSSKRCRHPISLVAIMKAVQALTAPNAQRSMQGTCT